MKNTDVKRMVTVEVTLTQTYTMQVECDAVNTVTQLMRGLNFDRNEQEQDNTYLRRYVARQQMTLVREGGTIRARRVKDA